jgi:hypothetical protein
MRGFALAAITVAVASVGLSGCTSPGLGYPGLAAPPQYSGAPYAPAAVVYPQYGVQPPEAPPISAYGSYLPPRAACAPVWSCGYRGCGWQPNCAPRPEPYAGSYGSARPQVYSAPQSLPAPQRYSGRSQPPVYSGPPRPYSGDPTYGSAYRP